MIRLQLDGLDAIEELERAVALARELRALGFDVTLTGDLYVTARMVIDPDQPDDGGPVEP